jgi:hypothetical protein
VAGGWRRLHNDELHRFYASQIIIVIKLRRMRWAGHVARMVKMRNAYKIVAEKSSGYPEDLGLHGRKNILMYLRDIGWEVVHWMYLA